MRKCGIQNMAFITTEKCNLDCKHCLRGEKCNKDISYEVIKKTLEQIKSIGNLCICGGEITLAVDKLEKIISYVIDNNINLEDFSLTVNGTIYSEELIRLLNYMSEYIKKKCKLAISYDKYHMDEINRLGLHNLYEDNVLKYIKSKHFYGFKELNPKLKLFREGKAVNLDNKITVPLNSIPYVVTYTHKKIFKEEQGLCNIGPVVCVNTDGIVTECDASNINQRTIYNYGNIFDNSLEEIVINRNAEIVKPYKFYNKCKKLIKSYNNYNE